MKLKVILVVACFVMMNCKSKKETTVVTTTTTPAESKQVEQAVGLNLGNKAPEILGNDPSGNPLSLSSLKGKMVLIDFWASWCGPCRRENPNVVNTFKMFKNKKFKNATDGFTVLGVSLDVNHDQWVAAIQKDSLIWNTHVCDFKGWTSDPAIKYQVLSIPNNYLINGNGIIVGSHLTGEDLNAALQKYVVN